MSFFFFFGLVYILPGVLAAVILKWSVISSSSGPRFLSMTCPSWVALHGMAHCFIELCKPLCHNKAVTHVGGPCSSLHTHNPLAWNFCFFISLPKLVILCLFTLFWQCEVISHCGFFLRFFLKMWTIFESLYWNCYNTASVLCFGFFGHEVCGS